MEYKKLTQIQQDLAYKLISEGNNCEMVAEGMSLNINTVYKYKNKFNINPNSPYGASKQTQWL